MDSTVYTRALAAADGLLAALLYLCKTTPILPISRNLNAWTRLNDIRVNLEHCRHRLIRSIPVLGLTSCDRVLDSLFSPTSFYEAAIFSFRYTLTGPAPDSLGNILALYTLSHIASCYLSREGFSVIPLEDGFWRNAIRNQEHRQAFSSLVQTLWSDKITPPYPSLGLYPFHTALPGIFSTQYGVRQDMFGAPGTVNHNEHVLYSPERLLPCFFHGHLNLNTPPLSRQIVHSGYCNNTPDASTPSIGHHTSHLLELQQSAVITNLIHFLESCGETLQILSGRNMATKDLQSGIALNQDVKQLIRTSYIQPLREDEAFRWTSALATLSVVERFVDLEYLQSIDEVREYMVLVGIVGRVRYYFIGMI
jgi:hypothetical protein